MRGIAIGKHFPICKLFPKWSGAITDFPKYTFLIGVVVHFGEKPDTLLEKPTRFVVLNNNYYIRFAPTIDDTSGQIWDAENNRQFHGNIIGKLPKGAKGFARGKKTDSSGREWWYVEIDEEHFPIGYAFVKKDEKIPTKVAGCIISRFVSEF